MTMNTVGRPTNPGTAQTSASETFSGHRGLDHEEPLLFERGRLDNSGVDLPDVPKHKSRLGGLARKGDIGLPGLSEPETMRHYVRLSRKNYAIDSGLYPLGSCTMKHNARLNEKIYLHSLLRNELRSICSLFFISLTSCAICDVMCCYNYKHSLPRILLSFITALIYLLSFFALKSMIHLDAVPI